MVHIRQADDGIPFPSTGSGDTSLGQFGNAGALYKGAMTWWDHETLSIWAQPTGEALSGPLEGTRLGLLPAQLIAWQHWQESYPHTFVMTNDLEQRGTHQPFRKGFVIGMALGDGATAFDFSTVVAQTVINDKVGDIPVMVWAEEQEYRAYFRQLGERTLTFEVQGEYLVDQETGTRWDPRLGRALSGPLAGEVLQAAPTITSFEWSWYDFYPETEIVSAERE